MFLQESRPQEDDHQGPFSLSHRGNRDGKMERKTSSLQEVWVYKPSGPGVFGPQGKAGLGWET